MSATGTSPQPIEVLYGDHHGWLRGWLRKRLGNAFDAADLAHDTYVRILASGATPQPDQSRRHLTQIANGLLIDLYRRRGIEAAYLEAIAALPVALAPSEEVRALAVEALIYAARRKALRTLGIAAAATAGATLLWRESGRWGVLTADHRSAVGEIRDITLADGSRVVLDSGSAIDVRFDRHERRILLLAGEILVSTAVDAQDRPLRVQSRQVMVQALGTRFTLRDAGPQAHLAVYQGAVDVYPGAATQAVLRVHEGERTRFDPQRAEPPAAAREADAAWTRGVLLAEDMRLADFTARLARYRSGFLRCDPAVADLRVTGVFPLRDTDRALHNLTLGVPVDIHTFSRYWVTVGPRASR